MDFRDTANRNREILDAQVKSYRGLFDCDGENVGADLNNPPKNRTGGFSLVELMVAVGIIGVLAYLASYGYDH